MSEPRIIYYYQTLTDLSSVCIENGPVSHIVLSSFHFGTNSDKSPYIHLNNYPPTDPRFAKPWAQLKNAYMNYNIQIHIMLGGAGSAFETMFSDYSTYYNLLLETILTYPFITGINLDVEEEVSLENIKKLICDLKGDCGPNFTITMAPIQSALQTNQPGMGGFSYKDLYNSAEGKYISWFNGQFYFELLPSAFIECVENGYPASKVVLGMIQDQDFETAKKVVSEIKAKHPDFGGVYMWEYFNAPPEGEKNPGAWAVEMKKIISSSSENIFSSYCNIS